MEGFRVSKKEKPTDEIRSIEIPREDKLEAAAKNYAEAYKRRFAEVSVGQSFETERDL